MKALRQVYTSEGADIRFSELEMETGIQGSPSSGMRLKDNAPKALIVCLIFSVFQQLSGINGIIFYSS